MSKLKFGTISSLERNWEKDKENMKDQVANLGGYPDDVWVKQFKLKVEICHLTIVLQLLLFAEGTRFTPSKHVSLFHITML